MGVVLVFLCLLITSLTAQDTTGVATLAGRLLDAEQAPVAGRRVCALEAQRCDTTREDGSFRIADLRPGSYTLIVTLDNNQELKSEQVEARAGVEASVLITLPKITAVEQSITVTDRVFLPPEEVKNSGYLVGQREIFKSAGALQDVSRYVQTLPGIAIGSDDFRNDIIVRGGSPLENLFIVDNIEIPNINAFANFASAGGTVALLDAALIQDVTFLTGGYPAPFINRTSGVLQIAQREGDREQFRGRATLGFAGAGTILEGPIRKGKGSWVTSIRRSFLDFFTNNIGFGGVPVAYTYNAKVLYDFSPKDRLWIANVSGNDRIRLGLAEGNTDLTQEINNFDIRYNGWRSATGLNWQRLLGERGVSLLGLTHSEARIRSNVKDLVRFGLPPPNQPVAEQIANAPTVFRESSAEGESTVKYDLTAYLPGFDKLQTGGSFKIFRPAYNTASPFGRDTPFSLVPGVNRFAVNTSFLAYQSGLYFQNTRNFGGRINLTWGGRFDNYQYVSSSRFSPRVGLSYRINERMSWRASYGAYFQQPFFLFLAVFPENRGLIPWRADHYVTGLLYTISSSVRMSAEVYQKDYKDYPVSLQFPTLSLANVGDTFDVSSLLFPLTSAGRGRVRGLEIFIEKRFSEKWFGQANFSRQRARQAGLDGIPRPASFEYPYIFNLVGGYRITPKWELSLRTAYLTGRPFTPFNLVESARQRRPIFDLSQVNALRLPDYFRLDMRLDRTFTVRGKPLLVFFGAQNVTNRKNIAGFTWNRRTNQQIANEQLGLFPLVGLDWRF
ncbi:MAG: TonB-dependent receptor [Bryobacteraceae bacterium]|nr:TonB-dependent receptor [Bryobacteraceae bacterium]MDW8378833.1 TonB-dependent receptor [Bryobacterales bacterium]